MAKGSSGISGGGNIGSPGTGIALETRTGTKFYRVTESNILLEISGSSSPMKTGDLTTKEFVQNAIDNGKATFLSRNEVSDRINKLRETQANKPDYEMGLGVAGGTRGRSKTVYRPRRGK